MYILASFNPLTIWGGRAENTIKSMASPQKENGYTPISNELLEALIRYKYPPNTGSLPLKICLFIIRKTYGYRKKMDIISLSQFQKATNEKSRTNLVYWVKYLVQANVLVRIEKSKTHIEYGFNKNYEQWLDPVQAIELVQARLYTGTTASTKTSTSHRTYKRKKENTKENSDKSQYNFSQITEIIKAFEEIDAKNKTYYSNKTQRDACQFLIDTYGFEKVIELIPRLKETNRKSVYQITTPWEMKEKITKVFNDISRIGETIKSKNTKHYG